MDPRQGQGQGSRGLLPPRVLTSGGLAEAIKLADPVYIEDRLKRFLEDVTKFEGTFTEEKDKNTFLREEYVKADGAAWTVGRSIELLHINIKAEETRKEDLAKSKRQLVESYNMFKDQCHCRPRSPPRL